VTLRAYYRGALLLPVVVPLLFAPGLLFINEMTLLGAVVLGTLVVSPLVGAVPAVPFLFLVRRWTRGGSARRLRRVVLLAPLVFAPLLGLFLLPILWVGRGSFRSAAEVVGGWSMPFALALGYVYVAMTEAGRVVLEARGRIEREMV
jgi:hypothetical protein